MKNTLITQLSIPQFYAEINELLHKIRDEKEVLILEERRLINEEITGDYDLTLSHNYPKNQLIGVK